MMKLYLVNVQMFFEAEDEEAAEGLAHYCMGLIPDADNPNGYNVLDAEELPQEE